MPEPEVVSPKSQAYEATVPSESADAEASKEQLAPEQVEMNDAVGAWLAATVTGTCLVTVPVAPLSSVTVSFTEYVPEAEYA